MDNTAPIPFGDMSIDTSIYSSGLKQKVFAACTEEDGEFIWSIYDLVVNVWDGTFAFRLNANRGGRVSGPVCVSDLLYKALLPPQLTLNSCQNMQF